MSKHASAAPVLPPGTRFAKHAAMPAYPLSLRTARTRIALACVLLTLVPAAVSADAGRQRRGVEVVGDGRVEVGADLAQIDFAVVSEAPTAAAAARDNAERMQRVIAALRAPGKDASIQTGTYSVRPLYAATRDQRPPHVTGFVVSNAVHVRTRALARVGEMIDAAIGAGANQVQRLEFTLEDTTAAQREALRRAALDARDKAEVLARAVGMRLGAVRSITEQDVGAVRPLARFTTAMHAESAPPTPIEPGKVDVRARVALAVEFDGAAAGAQPSPAK